MHNTLIEMKGSPGVGRSVEEGRSSTLTTIHTGGGLKSVCTHRPNVSASQFPVPAHPEGLGTRDGQAAGRQGRLGISGKSWAGIRPAPDETSFVSARC